MTKLFTDARPILWLQSGWQEFEADLVQLWLRCQGRSGSRQSRPVPEAAEPEAETRDSMEVDSAWSGSVVIGRKQANESEHFHG